MANSLAHQVKIVTWPPFFDVEQPIKRRLRRKKHRQLEENIIKNDGCGNKFNASGFFKTETAYININFFAGFYCFLTCSSKNYTDPADERRNNFTKMTHPFIMLPDADEMNMKCLPDSGFLMAHTAINKPCFFSILFSLAAVLAHPPKFIPCSDRIPKKILPGQAFALPVRLVEGLTRHIFCIIHEFI
jgi:hypothetical protein